MIPKVTGNKKEKKMLKQQSMSINLFIENIQTSIEHFEGRAHLVAPVVMLKEGVHNNSSGRMYYPASVVSRFPGAWNGVPLPIDHPSDDEGYLVSANYPKIVEEQSVGRVWNVLWDGEKLKGELWIDIEKAKAISPNTLTKIQNDRQLEISTAHWGEHEISPGTWNGEEYDLIAKEIIPDHLALLPDGTGACSWADGCGVRANMKGGDGVQVDKYLSPFFNEISHGDIRSQLRGLLPAGSDNLWYFIRDVFDAYFVYVKEVGDKPTLYKQAYTKDASDVVSLAGDAVEVVEKTDYVKTNLKKEVTQMAEKKVCCPKQVAALIANKLSVFVDDDKEWLEGLSEGQLAKLEPIIPDEVIHFDLIDWGKLTDDQLGAIKANLKLQEVKDEGDTNDIPPATLDEYVANAPPEMQDVLKDGLRMYRGKKTKMVETIMANKRSKFTKEQLEGKDTEELSALVELGQSAPADYTANDASQESGQDDETLDMPVLNFDK